MRLWRAIVPSLLVQNFAKFLKQVEDRLSEKLSTISLLHDLERRRFTIKSELLEIENEVLGRVASSPEIICSTDPNNFEAKPGDRKFKTILGIFEQNLTQICVSIAELTDGDPKLLCDRIEGYVQGLEHTRTPATTVGDNLISSCIATFVDFAENPILAVENNPSLLLEEFFSEKYTDLVKNRPEARPEILVYNAIAHQHLEEQLGRFS